MWKFPKLVDTPRNVFFECFKMSKSCSSFEFSRRWVQCKHVEVVDILLFQILSNCQTETSKAVQLSQSLGQRVHRIEDWFWGGSGKGKVTVVINIMKDILRGWRMSKWLGAGGGWGHKKWQPDHLSRSASGSDGSNLTLEPNITKALKVVKNDECWQNKQSPVQPGKPKQKQKQYGRWDEPGVVRFPGKRGESPAILLIAFQDWESGEDAFQLVETGQVTWCRRRAGPCCESATSIVDQEQQGNFSILVFSLFTIRSSAVLFKKIFSNHNSQSLSLLSIHESLLLEGRRV